LYVVIGIERVVSRSSKPVPAVSVVIDTVPLYCDFPVPVADAVCSVFHDFRMLPSFASTR
jgi:hypothetical protein